MDRAKKKYVAYAPVGMPRTSDPLYSLRLLSVHSLLVFGMFVMVAGTAAASTRPGIGPLSAVASGFLTGPGNRNGKTKDQEQAMQQRNQPHLAQWLRQHQNMPLQQQQRALQNEPGFNRLSQEQQQRLMGRLQQLHDMSAPQRERTLQGMEALEKLSPEQRREVHNVMQEVGHLPEDRQRMIHKAFRDLSQLPPTQRRAELASPQFKGQFSDRERQILGTLMSVQPYLPLPGTSTEDNGKQ
ncbi:MAG: DUF3106 domain-containing protein [Acidobacteriaceae bacterium]